MTFVQIILSLFLSLSCPNCTDTIDISGTVVDRDSKTPITGVHVFIAGSEKGIDTDIEGKFSITNIEQETFQLIFSHVGYQTRTINFDAKKSSRQLNVSLKAEETLLDEVVVNAKKDRKWNRDLKKFKQFFFGEGYNENLISIENDYLIEFMDKKGRDLIVDNRPALDIQNKHLGYEVYFQLIKFELSDIKTYLGFSNFREMTPADDKEQKRWKRNRLTAYKGSTRHFFKSLIDRRLDQEGYGVTLEPQLAKGKMATGMLSKKEELRYDDEGIYKRNINVTPVSDKVFEISFKGLMEIVFYDEEDQYGDPQSSEIMLSTPLKVHKNGVVMNPGALLANGFWTLEGMQEALPFEYDPEK
ncbi:MAG: carboxypeptidase-like regulatory domain-containing protein [Roseivirga sp.]